MFQCFRSVMGTIRPQPQLCQHTWQLTGPVPWISWHLPHEWLADDSECLERPDRNHSAQCHVYSVYHLPSFVVPPHCHAPRGQRFLCSLSGHQPHTVPTEAAALLAEAQVTSAGIFCPPRGALRSPCNPSHSCRFDTFLYKGNTSRGRNFSSVKSWTEWQNEIQDGVKYQEKYNAIILMDM